ncbi:hypothetical protein ABZT45_46790 [Streptomyces sp. NPDC005356]|uniref:hypothetical protein n=1 Tax=Streptomyces sp. NPDC005356 TaxID=3157167 RepID=UPI0033B3A35E
MPVLRTQHSRGDAEPVHRPGRDLGVGRKSQDLTGAEAQRAEAYSAVQRAGKSLHKVRIAPDPGGREQLGLLPRGPAEIADLTDELKEVLPEHFGGQCRLPPGDGGVFGHRKLGRIEPVRRKTLP